MKKILSILLVVAMVASLVAMLIVPASASTDDTRAVTADDVTVESYVNGNLGTTDVLFDGIKPEPGLYGWSNQVWDKKANGDYLLITFEDQVLITDLAIQALGNWPFAIVKGYNALGEEVFSKGLNPDAKQEGLSVVVSILSSGTDNPIDVKSIKIVNDYEGKILRIGEIEISAHFHTYGSTATDITNPTCSKPGTGVFTCTSCTRTKTDKVTDPLGNHVFSTEGTKHSDATADTQGEVRYPCLTTGCDAYLVELTPITAHNCGKNVVAPDCENGGYIEYTCDKTCGDENCDYTYKTAERTALGHQKADNDDGTLYSKATIISNEIRTYACQRTDCGENFQAEVLGTQLKNPDTATMILTNDNIVSFEEVLADGGAGDKTQLFDEIKAIGDGGFYKPSNFWQASTGSTLTVTFDKEYILLDARIFAASNENSLKIQYFNAEGEEVGTASNLYLEMGTDVGAVDVTGLELQPVKEIVITVVNAKWPQGSGMKLVELEITAHACDYKTEDRTNVQTVPAECKTTFDGTCHLCGIYAEDVVEYNHAFEKVENSEELKIYTDREGDVPVSCYKDGKGYYLCTVCSAKKTVISTATGEHVFEKANEVAVKDNEADCGNPGRAYMKCSTPGCIAVSEEYDVPATGNHSKWNWKILEGHEPDYTHTGLKGYFCGVCGYQDTSKEDQIADMVKLDCISQKDWSVRYTDFVSPRATFKISKTNISAVEDEFDVKIFGVVTKGEVSKEVQVYGEGATGKVANDGTFSLVVQGGSYTDEYKFSVRVEITCKADNSKNTATTTSKNITTAPDGVVSALDVANYYLSPSKVNGINAEIKKFYESIVASAN